MLPKLRANSLLQGFHHALKPALMARWHVTAHDLAELCRGGPLNPQANFGIRRSFCCCVHADVPRQLAEALYEVCTQKAEPVPWQTQSTCACQLAAAAGTAAGLSLVSLALWSQTFKLTDLRVPPLSTGYCGSELGLRQLWLHVQHPGRRSSSREPLALHSHAS